MLGIILLLLYNASWWEVRCGDESFGQKEKGRKDGTEEKRGTADGRETTRGNKN